MTTQFMPLANSTDMALEDSKVTVERLFSQFNVINLIGLILQKCLTKLLEGVLFQVKCIRSVFQALEDYVCNLKNGRQAYVRAPLTMLWLVLMVAGEGVELIGFGIGLLLTPMSNDIVTVLVEWCL